MTDFDYKNYSLSKLEDWLHDCISSGEASSQEVYDVITKVVKEQYYYYKDGASKTYELLALLNGNGIAHFNDMNNTKLTCDKDDTSPECKGAWSSFWEENYYPEEYESSQDKVVKWQLPVEMDGPSGEYFVSFPDDLLEAANLKEGDEVEWVDNKDGTFTLRKITRPLRMDEC